MSPARRRGRPRAGHLTSNKVRQIYLATMGDELGRQFHLLSKECTWLHLKWREYVALFGATPSRVQLLNASARGFFGLLEISLDGRLAFR